MLVSAFYELFENLEGPSPTALALFELCLSCFFHSVPFVIVWILGHSHTTESETNTLSCRRAKLSYCL